MRLDMIAPLRLIVAAAFTLRVLHLLMPELHLGELPVFHMRDFLQHLTRPRL
jgi:hypothetical protein